MGDGRIPNGRFFSEELQMDLIIANIYEPCQIRVEFWESLVHSSLLMEDNIVLGGDLNFSMVYAEYSGNHAHIRNL